MFSLYVYSIPLESVTSSLNEYVPVSSAISLVDALFALDKFNLVFTKLVDVSTLTSHLYVYVPDFFIKTSSPDPFV